MEKAIQILMDEHRVIEGVLGALETYAHEVRGGLELARPDVARFATFFRDFADACHHGKEEDLLFRKMVDLGFPSEGGPIGVMLYEHRVGREHVGALRRVGTAAGAVAAADRSALLAAADGYIPLLRAHIQKEDSILYPMAVQVIARPGMDALVEAYGRFESQLTGEAAPDALLRLAEQLRADFPPDAVRIAAAACGTGGCWSQRG